jgi:stage II sporulation protein M
MEREEDYDSTERREGVSIEAPNIKDKGYAAREENFSTANLNAKILSDDSNSRKVRAGYLRSLSPYVIIITFVFFGSFLAGYLSAENFPDMANNMMKEFTSRFAPLLEQAPIYVMFRIFLNNAFVSLVYLVLGLALGVFPILFIASNGFLVGVISYLVGQQKGFLFILLALIPHGIIELPMVFLSASIGLRLGYHVLLYLIGKPTEIKRELKQGLKFYFRWIMPLLFVAAVIEAFITPLILSLI